MQKGIMDVKLVERPSLNRSQGKKGANGHHLGHGGEGLMVIETLLLVVSFGDETSLVVLNGSIGVVFDVVNPL